VIVKKPLLVMSCMVIVLLTQAAGAQETAKCPDKQIEELSEKFFFYSTTDGKQSLTSTTEPEKDWYCKRFGDACDHTIVKLTSPGAALSIPGTSLILAFLCASRYFAHDSIVTIFDRNNLDVPLCYSRLYLMDDREESSREIQSLEARESRDKGLHVVVKLSGADDIGDGWTSFTFLQMDLNCKITVLSKIDSAMHCNGGCEGNEMEYHFVDNNAVEVMTKEMAVAEEKTTKVVKTTQKKYQLEELYTNPESRIFPSKIEKAAALLSSGADVNIRDKDGTTPLMWAVEKNSLEVVKGLLDNGAEVEAKDNNGQTALMDAAYWGHLELVELLVEKGADVNAKDEHGRTAMTWASRNLHPRIVEFLKAHGAKE
jgi:Ankyrin repeats (3 copies)